MRKGIFRSVFAAALALLLLHGAPAAARAAQAAAGESDRVLTLKEAGRDFLRDTGKIWTSPLRIKSKHVGPIVTFAAATTFLMAADENIRDAVQGYVGKHRWVGDVGPVVTEMGSLGGLAAAGVFFSAGLIFRDERARDTGYLAASAIAQTFLVDGFIKGVTGRRRPFFADGEDHWSGPEGFFKRFDKDGEGAYSSFPSGHSASAFTLATVVALQYRDHPWVPVLAYTIASGVGLSRMTMDRHWASDVVVGAVIGHLVARLVVRDHGRRRRLVPALACSGRAVAVSVYYCFDPVGR